MRNFARVALSLGCAPWLAAQAPRELPLLTIDEYRCSGALGDVNGDRRIDLVLGKNGPFALRLGREPAADGTLQFEAEQTLGNGVEVGCSCESAGQPRLLDVDGDGDLDLVALDTPTWGRVGPTGVVWFANDGRGRFGARTMLHQLPAELPREPAQIELVDWNGDGRRDLLVGGVGQAWLLPGAATGFLAAQPLAGMQPRYGMAALDWDGDGQLDLVAAEQDGVHAYSRVDGQLTRIASLAGIRSDQCQLAAADHDGDGRNDLLVGEQVEQPGAALPPPEERAELRRQLDAAQAVVDAVEQSIAAERKPRPPFADDAAMARRADRLAELEAWAAAPRLAIERLRAALQPRPLQQTRLRLQLRPERR